ncbi:hypothetical protein Riv7116_2855 [Rivularia sp. PCC 7116]|uniref:hypothetical protein n=1 Tax=Rivularia sp. PCC 7116 TaxID=373994 RepID=UPI00029ED7AB|nr:hypothetical protein [Rivularia sp. PCC 7116]AFY55352.1 hypothetical protein Riv7116_2855 [Rivularia sp. PCC 7116]
MKKSIFTTAVLITSLLFVGCNNAQTNNTDNQIPSDNSEIVSDAGDIKDNSQVDSVNKDITDTSTNANKDFSKTTNPVKNVSRNLIAGKGQPKVGTIKRIEQGDLACYVTLIDEKGKEHNINADFDICADKEKFINQKVKLSYKILNFNDCQSIEPCGKTKKESAIVKMEVIGGSKSGKSSGDTQTLSNGEWTIKLSNYDSWNGVNNTGNVKYYGCDSKGNCLELTGGKVYCRNGKCVTGWKNGEYSYAIESAITEDGNNPQGSTLIVRQSGKVILRAEGLKSI